MRVYHFLGHQHGLENLRLRRLKIATLNDINDPFELLATASPVFEEREAFRTLRQEWAQRFGMLCFSRDWRNPVQWSHYAEKHRGLCLGFDVPDNYLSRITYSSSRIRPNWEAIRSNDKADSEKEILRWSTTKFRHWHYEQEERLFLSLDKPDEDGLYFCEFGDKLMLCEVSYGSLSEIARIVTGTRWNGLRFFGVRQSG